MRSLLGVGISVAMLGIRRHIHRMGIALHLGGSMSLVPHVRPLLDALIFFLFQTSLSTKMSTNLGISQSHGMPLQSLRCAISSSERMELTVVSM